MYMNRTTNIPSQEIILFSKIFHRVYLEEELIKELLQEILKNERTRELLYFLVSLTCPAIGARVLT
jgi:hypothetical protein